MPYLNPIGFDVVTNLPALESATIQHTPQKEVNFLDALAHTDQLYQNASEKVKAYAMGENIPVHDVMISLENAKLSFQFAVQVRNKLVEAYQEITRMQV